MNVLLGEIDALTVENLRKKGDDESQSNHIRERKLEEEILVEYVLKPAHKLCLLNTT